MARDRIPIVQPYIPRGIGESLRVYVESGAWLTEHDKTRGLEAGICQLVGARHCIMVPNGTLALYAALVAAGVGPGDQVIVPDLTMVATANAVLMAGAEVVLCDVTRWDLCLDLQKCMTLCTDRTKAIVVVDLNGRAPRMTEALRFFTGDMGITIIEDACQAFGSSSGSRYCGTVAAMGCYSFSPHKILTMGQGGAIVTDDDDLAFRLRRLRNFGRDTGGTDDHKAYGVNLKYTDLQALVGLEQIGDLQWRFWEKEATYAFYRDRLEGVGDLEFLNLGHGEIPWHVDVYTDRRDELAVYLENLGIGTRKMYPALHTLPPYTSGHGHAVDYPNSVRASARGLFIPSFLTITEIEALTVFETIKDFYKGD